MLLKIRVRIFVQHVCILDNLLCPSLDGVVDSYIWDDIRHGKYEVPHPKKVDRVKKQLSNACTKFSVERA